MNGIFNSSFKKVGDKLVDVNTGNDVRYKEFIKSLKEDTLVDLFIEINENNGTLPQLAKVHKCIRVIASETGQTFEGIKLAVKEKSGLIIKRKDLQEDHIDWKSFGDLSRDDLNLAIQTCIEIGDELGINLR